MNPFDGEVCRNGHNRTEENTSFVKDSQRFRWRKRCLDCTRVKNPKTNVLSIMAQARVDTLIELMDLGVDRLDIPERAGYANRKAVFSSLRYLGRKDIAERFKHYV